MSAPGPAPARPFSARSLQTSVLFPPPDAALRRFAAAPLPAAFGPRPVAFALRLVCAPLVLSHWLFQPDLALVRQSWWRSERPRAAASPRPGAAVPDFAGRSREWRELYSPPFPAGGTRRPRRLLTPPSDCAARAS